MTMTVNILLAIIGIGLIGQGGIWIGYIRNSLSYELAVSYSINLGLTLALVGGVSIILILIHRFIKKQ